MLVAVGITLYAADAWAQPLWPEVRIGVIAARAAAPESIDTVTLEAHGEAPAGFLAALLPLLVHFKLDAAVETTARRLRAQALRDNQHYYNDVLTLFGLGWLDDRFRFDRHGNLRLPWNGSCRAD